MAANIKGDKTAPRAPSAKTAKGPVNPKTPRKTSRDSAGGNGQNSDHLGISVPARADKPSSVDMLQRSHFVRALAALIMNEETETPLSIGIYGSWGSGKSSFMEMLRAELAGYRIVEFNVWRYSASAEIWTEFMARVVAALDAEMTFLQKLKYLFARNPTEVVSKLLARAEAARKKVGNWFTAILAALGAAASFPAVGRTPYIGRILDGTFLQNTEPELANMGVAGQGPIPTILFAIVLLVVLAKAVRTVRHPLFTQFQAYVRNAADDASRLRKLTQTELADMADAINRDHERKSRKHRPIIILLDDLDRCRPDRIVEVLEAINLMLANLPFIVVMGVDSRVVCKAIAYRYAFMLPNDADDKAKEEYGRRYLEKIIQVPFQLVPPVDFKDYIAHLLGERFEPDGPEKRSDGEDPGDILRELDDITGDAWIVRNPTRLLLRYVQALIRIRRLTMPNWRTNSLNWALGIGGRVVLGLKPTQAQESWLVRQDIGFQEYMARLDRLSPRRRVVLALAPLGHRRLITEAKTVAFRRAVRIAKNDVELLSRFSDELQGNPRTIKRFVNLYQLTKAMQFQLMQQIDSGDVPQLDTLASWLVLIQNWPFEASRIYAALNTEESRVNVQIQKAASQVSIPKEMEQYIRKRKLDLQSVLESNEYLGIVGAFSYFGGAQAEVSDKNVSAQGNGRVT